MSAADRNRELAADLARRAIAAAERRQAEAGAPDPADFAERLRGAADEDGRVSVDAAVEALTTEDRPDNPFTEYNARRAASQDASHRRLFPQPEPQEPSDRPQGSADGGEGELEDATYDYTLDGQRLRVWSDEELTNPNEETNR